MSTRDFILDAVRRNEPAVAALPEVPSFARAASLVPLDAFGQALARMGGNLVRPLPGMSLDAFVLGCFPGSHVVCSATPEVRGTLPIATVRDPRELKDVHVGVVRAAFGVAETGSVALGEHEFRVNALGFLSQHLVVLLDPVDIVETLHDAYGRADFFQARYAALMTGPSATADIEGVLVRGAQGIRSLTVIPVAR